MDLGKIIAQLRSELQCLDTVIASMEELARVQKLTDGENTEEAALDAAPDTPEPPKQRRGRPRRGDTQLSGPEPPAGTEEPESSVEDPAPSL